MEQSDVRGLTQRQVEQRIQQGQVNHSMKAISKSYRQIFSDHILTFFNFVNVVLLLLVISTGHYKNMLFIFVIVFNTCAGIFQELKAKKTLDRLAIVVRSHVEVLRDDQIQSIAVDEIVLDDCLILRNQDQVPTDCVVVSGTVEVNESLLTGEAEPIVKQPNDFLYSGSFVTAGKAYCKVVHVGADNYAETIVKEARKFKKHQSVLNQSLNHILKIVSCLIVPVGILLFVKRYWIANISYLEATLETVSALLGMIPQGLILLTTVSLSISVLRLAKKKVLVQEMFCIETLARVDVLCFDKTGTLTEGSMQLEQVIEQEKLDLADIIGNCMAALPDDNATAMALRQAYPPKETKKVMDMIPFSSQRKYSGVSFEKEGTYYLGAFPFLFPHGSNALANQVQQWASQGYRVLVLAHSQKQIEKQALPYDLQLCTILLLTDVLRDNVSDILEQFATQQVNVKIISGDDPLTVSYIAEKAHMAHADRWIDVSKLTDLELESIVDSYQIFGRVSPNQKKIIVQSLKKQGHTVAMTGDGVNDVLALKEADCSIAMCSGSDVARDAANIVLLDDQFANLPHVVNEGRRVIHQITAAASMFLIKTGFSILLAIATLLLPNQYPFLPIQLSVISAFGVGIPTFLMAYEANFQPINVHFFRTVLKKVVPVSFAIAICNLLIMNLERLVCVDRTVLMTMCVLLTAMTYILALIDVYSPFTKFRLVIVVTMTIGLFLTLYIGRDFLDLSQIISLKQWLFLGGMLLLSQGMIVIFKRMFPFFWNLLSKEDKI
ncbi:MAG: HAD-IC family P-type ATPase [Erysipelotrichaceae bacterium]|nr:HAD-IC family P-type ATPase [Erysipelotrichaceae bacterium]